MLAVASLLVTFVEGPERRDRELDRSEALFCAGRRAVTIR
jgi:hypothetical protein